MNLPKILIKKAPYSGFFDFWKATPAVRDLGDYVIWFCKYEFIYFKRDNPWKPK